MGEWVPRRPLREIKVNDGGITRYRICLLRCRNRDNPIYKRCNDLNTASPCYNYYPNKYPTVLPRPIEPDIDTCCPQCVADKCIVATGNPYCIIGSLVQDELLLLAKAQCYRDKYAEWLDDSVCHYCILDQYETCKDGCPQPSNPNWNEDHPDWME